jgi:phage shock protein E
MPDRASCRIANAVVLAMLVAAGCSHSDSSAPTSTASPSAPSAPGAASAPSSPSAPSPASSSAKDPAKARELIAAGAVVLDVRTPDEYRDGHLPTATNVPVDDVSTRLGEVDQLTHGDKAKPIVVYCAAGKRAARAKQTLESAGYTHVVNGGGFDDLASGSAR